MTRSFKKTALLAIAMTATTLHTVSAEACGGGRRASYSGGYARSYAPAVSYSQPSYSHPSYSQPVHSQPTYSQPVISQPIVHQPIINSTVPHTPVLHTPTAQNIVSPVSRPSTSSLSSTQPVATATRASSKRSALQILASLNTKETSETEQEVQIPEFTTASSTSESAPVGTWTVTLPGEQSVSLELKADGTFQWTATKKGNSSRFGGKFRIQDGRLTLVRESDLQQMSGTWTGNDKQFTFKLDGATTSGLAFRRS